jgi:cytochrome c2
MLYKIVRSLVSAGALLLATVSIAAAGGWAVITIDELPTEITAGRAFSIGFTVRQHGKTLRSDLKPIVRFTRSDARESFEVTAQRQGDEGHYAAEIEFPGAGQWNWHVDIEQFGMITQPMPMLKVQAVPAGARPAAFIRILEYIKSMRQALSGKVSTTTAPVSLTVLKTTRVDQAAWGKALFSAKGCVMCHAHAAVKVEDGPFGFDEVAPDLSQKTYGAEYLRLWLHDPQAVKPQTQMPRVQMNDREIEALIAFLQSE